ncbi:MAG: hypothetical protein HYV28_20680, partial [Ignavibacteriales bacterium]|nr:hypothetical protein [Ignavibacteriales bacterium]
MELNLNVLQETEISLPEVAAEANFLLDAATGGQYDILCARSSREDDFDDDDDF